MAVNSIYQQDTKSNTNNILMYILIVIGVVAVIFFGISFIKNISGLSGKSDLTVEVLNGDGEVFLNDETLGSTPLKNISVKAGENRVKVKNDSAEYDVSLNFLPNSEIVLKRDLGVSKLFSSGQNFWLEKSDSDTVLSVISEPSGAKVYIDGTEVGTTPYSSNSLTAGDYDFRIEQSNYEAQVARIAITEGHKLNVSVTLFPLPVSANVSLLEDSDTLYDVSSDNLSITSDVSSWVKAILYWNKTRGISLSGAGVNKDVVFDFYLDYMGNIYDKDGNKLAVSDVAVIQDARRGAYLRKTSDGPGLSDAAKTVFLSLGEVGTVGKQATVLDTGLGWLRVRDEPGLDGTEITRVNVGDVFSVLEETPGWVKIKVSDTVEGWVSDSYVSVE